MLLCRRNNSPKIDSSGWVTGGQWHATAAAAKLGAHSLPKAKGAGCGRRSCFQHEPLLQACMQCMILSKEAATAVAHIHHNTQSIPLICSTLG